MNVRVSRIVKVDLKQRTTYRFSLILKRLVDDGEVRAQIVLLWQSTELYRTAPTVADANLTRSGSWAVLAARDDSPVRSCALAT